MILATGAKDDPASPTFSHIADLLVCCQLFMLPISITFAFHLHSIDCLIAVDSDLFIFIDIQASPSFASHLASVIFILYCHIPFTLPISVGR